MAGELTTAKEFEESVVEDRATAIRESAKQNSDEDKSDPTKAIGDQASKKVLDKVFLNINNSIWGLTFSLIPLLGLTLLMSAGLIIALFLKKVIGSSLEGKGFSLEISLLTLLYTWGTFVVQLLLTVFVYAIIYIIVNPLDFVLDFVLDAIGL